MSILQRFVRLCTVYKTYELLTLQRFCTSCSTPIPPLPASFFSTFESTTVLQSGLFD
jgi:hypothetical protein